MKRIVLHWVEISKAARNERVKLLASSFNTIGLAVLGLGFLTQVFTGTITRSTVFRMLASVLILVVLHFIARMFLRSLRD